MSLWAYGQQTITKTTAARIEKLPPTTTFGVILISILRD
jgi:hypothetical protein